MAQKYYLGLDIGTDSIGYAVTNDQYDILKYRGEPAWGVHLFDAANLAAERRSFRVARRRIERRKQRVDLLQELFAPEIAGLDPRFFIRQQESALCLEDKAEAPSLFNDPGYTDRDYHAAYPTIHHLIVDLMNTDEKRDVRLVYLACAWLVAHRGHFLNEIDRDNIAAITEFSAVYRSFTDYFTDRDKVLPFAGCAPEAFGDALKMKANITRKSRALFEVCFPGGKPPKKGNETTFPYNCELMLKGLCGGKISAKDLFDGNEAYADIKSFTLGSDDDTLSEVMGQLGDEDAELIVRMKALYDWSLLVGILSGCDTISEAKVAVYEQHRSDLSLLKRIVRKYLPGRYAEVFRESRADNYCAYAYHGDDLSACKGKATQAGFCAYIRKLLKDVAPDEDDREAFDDMLARLELESFMPKQKDTNNRVIPYQLYWHELDAILKRAEGTHPFLTERDADGLSVSDKIRSILSFRIPYFVGPLNAHSSHAWVVRERGRVYPWNFEHVVDLDASEAEFIRRLINKCTYLPGENVLPKDSLLYHRYMVLNEINNLRVNDSPISVEAKQGVYEGVFMRFRKVTPKRIREWLESNGHMRPGDTLGGIDQTIKADLKPWHDFRRLLESGTLTEAQAEEIIERRSYSEDAFRFRRWLVDKYGFLSRDDIAYISRLNYKDFGRLSRRFLSGLEGTDGVTGELTSIIGVLWNTNLNLMQIIHDERYNFGALIDAAQKEYYSEHPATVSQRLEDMYVSAAVRRPILRTLEIVREVAKAFDGAPEKIFVEMARGGLPDQKGKRTQSRREQLLSLYDKCRDEDVRLMRRQLEEMGEEADNRLQSDKLFLYYTQLGRCMYTGEPIDLEQLAHGDTGRFNIEHIYPQAAVSDDSVINNKVLVDSRVNGEKKDSYPIAGEIREKMYGFWRRLKDCGLIGEEKFKRLTRSTPFSADEKWGFINRQLTETTQSTKAVATLLKELFPDAEVVFVKARLASEFRQEFDCVKSRLYNDLHHAKDAYLNIVTGNVYHMKFTRRWFSVDGSYSVKLSTLFTRQQIVGGQVIWGGTTMLEKVRRIVGKNNIHFTKYAYRKQGGFFDQMPVSKAEGLVRRKKELPTEKYGGYNKPGVAFFLPVRYRVGKKKDIMIMPVELLYRDEMLSGEARASAYALRQIGKILGKTIDEVSFPLGLRPLKVNTVLSLDGFEVCISGNSGGGRAIKTAPMMSFVADHNVERYLKRLEMLCEKKDNNPAFIYRAEFDKVTPEENIALYRLYIQKLRDTILRKRINNPLEALVKGETQFLKLDIFSQAHALLNIHLIFNRQSAGGCDLTAIGGVAHAGAMQFSTNVSNWKKNYTDVRIIDRAASGLWEKRSDNLLDLL